MVKISVLRKPQRWTNEEEDLGSWYDNADAKVVAHGRDLSRAEPFPPARVSTFPSRYSKLFKILDQNPQNKISLWRALATVKLCLLVHRNELVLDGEYRLYFLQPFGRRVELKP